MIRTFIIVSVLCIFPVTTFTWTSHAQTRVKRAHSHGTDAEKKEWFGDWAMTFDGSASTLRIVAKENTGCVDPPWCDMEISYLDENGKKYPGSIETIEDKWHHMVFSINFTENPQRFDAYLFSWDKLRMAGTTSSQGRTFPFYATKQAGNRRKSLTSITELREIAQRINSEEFLRKRANQPKFSINRTERTFLYSQGDLPDLTFSYGQESQIATPLARLMQLDDLRKVLASGGADLAFWNPYFDLAEAMIEKKMLTSIASGTSTTDMLLGYDRVIGEIFQDLAPEAFGRDNLLGLKRPTRRILSRDVVRVIFVIDPRPAQLFIVDDLTYALAESGFGELTWREILEDNPQLGGRYWYKVVWPDQIRGPELILVDQANKTFTIRK